MGDSEVVNDNEDEILEEVADLEIESIIGFDGNTLNGLQIHPDKIHIIYPLGMKVAIQNWKTKKQDFLSGHTNAISTVAISPNGKYIASGQINHMGFKASVIIWSFETKEILDKHEIHKVRVESVAFSCDNCFLVSLGGRDDGNVVIWNMENREAMCGFTASPATAGDATLLCPMFLRGRCFISAGSGTLRLWRISVKSRKVRGIDVSFGMIKRVVTCVVVDINDLHAYCGTTTGDIVKIRLNYDYDREVMEPVSKPVLVGCYGKHTGKKKQADGSYTERWSLGVTALCLSCTELTDLLFVGSGDGTVELVTERVAPRREDGKLRTPSEPQFVGVRSAQIGAEVTSLHRLEEVLIAGTSLCEIYTINIETFSVILHVTCHTSMVHDIAFPYLYPDVFATCSLNDVRIWDTKSSLELLRITVPNFTCTCITFAFDGKSIISGWNDGEIRAFTPQTGRLMYDILNAHNRGVTALAVTSDGKRIVSGGGEGQVRVWEVHPEFQTLQAVLKEHKGPVSKISMSQTDEEVVSSSSDGTCIVWDIVHMVRKQVLFANTQFNCVVYHPTGVQMVTCGTDRKIAYWEAYDGSLLRELDGSSAAAINAVDITRDGNYLATAGCDLYVKVWKYKDGIAVNYGLGHAATICAVKFSPDSKFIISVSADGAIIRWKCPYPLPDDFDDYYDDYHSTHSTCSVRETNWNKSARNLKKEKANKEENAEKTLTALLESVKEEAKDCVCVCISIANECGDAIQHTADCPQSKKEKESSVCSKSSSAKSKKTSSRCCPE